MLNYLRNRYRKRKEKKKKTLKRKIILTLTIVVVVLVVVVMYFSDDDMLNYQIKRSQAASSNNIYEEQEGVTRTVYYTNSGKSGSGKGKGMGANGSIDASTEEVIKAITEIVGTFDDAWIKGTTNMQPNQIALFKELLPMAIATHLKYPNMWTSAIMYTKTEESGWTMTGTTSTSHNLMGIKAYGNPTPYWTGSKENSNTGEGEGGGRYYMNDAFRSYPSFQDSVLDFGAFINIEPLYKTGGNHQMGITGDAANCLTATSGQDQSLRIINAGYMTAPTGYTKDLERYTFCQLDRFDDLADKVAQALGNGSGNYDGEWNPSGGSLDKIVEAGVDLASISDKRKKVLAEGEALLGTPYKQVRPYVLPNKNEDGTYDVATGLMDCSAFTSHCVMEALGIDIGGNTFAQMASSNLESISAEEAKAGDLYFPHSGHVTFLLAKNGDGTLKVIHEPGTGQVCKIGNYNLTSGHRFYRVKGIDD